MSARPAPYYRQQYYILLPAALPGKAAAAQTVDVMPKVKATAILFPANFNNVFSPSLSYYIYV